jgi:putative transposase
MATPPKITDLDYIQFLLAAQTAFTCTEAARCSGAPENTPAHDAYSRLLTRLPPDTKALWEEVQPFVQLQNGVLVLDDSTLDKPYARHMDLRVYHWSGKHKRSVPGINLITLLWTDGGAKLPIDCRLYDKPTTGNGKNTSFKEMLATAQERGFTPSCVCFDSWYSSLDNLKTIRTCGWRWLTCLEKNRQVNPDGQGNVRLDQVVIPEEGLIVHLRGYGLIRVFCEPINFEEARYWATNDLDMTQAERAELAGCAWAIEEYHRGLKQCCGVEGCPARRDRMQRNHILLSIRAFVRLEVERLRTGKSWYTIKKDLIRQAIRQYLAQPTLSLLTTA